MPSGCSTSTGSPTLGWVIHQFGYGTMFAGAAVWMAVAALVFAFWDAGGARDRGALAAEQPALP